MEKFLTRLFEKQSVDPRQFFLLAGPCVVESEDLVMEVAEKVSAICQRLQIPYVFKSSYRKANRTSASSFTGLGDERALGILGRLKEKTGLPVVTDIHSPEEAAMAAAHIKTSRRSIVLPLFVSVALAITCLKLDAPMRYSIRS